MTPSHYPLEAIRGRFPALSLEDAGSPRLYFDNPAGTQVVDAVAQRMSACLLEANANLGGYFETSRRAGAVDAEAHQAMADFLNAPSRDEIVYGQNMTTLTLHLSRSIGRTMKPGDEIIVTRMDHDANITPWTLLAGDLGLTVKWLPFDPDTFEFNLSALDELITERTRLICAGGASNLTGTINDVKAICAKARAAGALTYIDAVQLAPHVAIDVQDLRCDFLVCSAYKFFGPHQGILWGRGDLLQSLVPYKVRPAPSSIPGCFETGTQSHEGMAGTAAAVGYYAWIGENFAADHHQDNARFEGRSMHVHAALDYLFAYERSLAHHLIEGLERLPGVRIQGLSAREALPRRVPTVAFTAQGVQPDHIARELARRNIFVWSGHNYAVEVVESLGLHHSGGVVRVGPVHYNTIEEIDQLLNALDDILRMSNRRKSHSPSSK